MAHMSSGSGYSHEPNVVPFIDVLLVLLIIFMVQIPLQRKVMDVQIPPEEEVERERMQEAESDQIVLELLANGGYAINEDPVPFNRLDQRLHEIYDERPAKLMFIKPARSRHYQDIIEAMDVARGAGVQVIGFTPPNVDREETGGG